MMMNKKISVYGSVVNLIAVICFALSMLFGFNHGSYFSSMFIAFSFVLMMCGYAYFAQLTTVRLNDLTQQAAILLDFQQCGLLFNYDLPGYAVMSLAAFLQD